MLDSHLKGMANEQNVFFSFVGLVPNPDIINQLVIFCVPNSISLKRISRSTGGNVKVKIFNIGDFSILSDIINFQTKFGQDIALQCHGYNAYLDWLFRCTCLRQQL
jgi:hypothetical protein